ncbi:unnamed protein product [Urochloa humidicola]
MLLGDYVLLSALTLRLPTTSFMDLMCMLARRASSFSIRMLPSYQKLPCSVRDTIMMPRHCMACLNISEGPQDLLVLAGSYSDKNINRFSTIVRALKTLLATGIVEHRTANVGDFVITVDPPQKYGFILCPDHETALLLWGRSLVVGEDNISFELVSNVRAMPFVADRHQHLAVSVGLNYLHR